jgi:hypothetical protein
MLSNVLDFYQMNKIYIYTTIYIDMPKVAVSLMLIPDYLVHMNAGLTERGRSDPDYIHFPKNYENFRDGFLTQIL